MRRFASIVTAPVAMTLAGQLRAAGSLNRSTILDEVKSKSLFEHSFIESRVNKYLDELKETSYSVHFEDKDVALHVQGLLTAEAREALGDTFRYIHETEGEAFYLCRNTPAEKLAMVRRVAAFSSWDRLPEGQGSTIRSYLTANRQIAIFSARHDKFVQPTPAAGETSLDVLGTESYLKTVQPNIRAVHEGLMVRQRKSVFPAYNVEEKEGNVNFTMAATVERTNYIASLLALFQEKEGVEVVASHCYTFSNGVQMYSFTLSGATVAEIEERASLVGLLPNRPYNAITRLHEESKLTCEETVFIDAALIFSMYFTPAPADDDYSHLRAIVQREPNGVNRLNNLRQSLSQEMMSERYTGSLIAMYPEFAKAIYEDFKNGSTPERRAEIIKTIQRRLNDDERSPLDFAIFKSFLKFNEVILKHNFFKADKAALCFRLDPAFLAELEYPAVPHGVFLLAGGQWRGFHIRFTDIARGGVRMIISKENSYRKNKRSVFQENYNLAHTQLLKNKDIPEGGSKGTILVSSRYLQAFNPTLCGRLFLQYVDGLLDCMLPGEKGIKDNYKKEEILFLGPDENTAGNMPAAGALYSKDRGYSAWKSFTTGKDSVLGGIPHDEFGMTTHSVRTYVKGIYEKLGLKEESMRKFQTGGPDGDLGSNEVLVSKEVMIGMVDISASLHDPNGLDRAELARLATERLTLCHFDRSKLSKDGFLVLTEDKNVTLPDGTVVEDGSRLRDEFHFLKYSDADVFVPCGGRPRSVTLNNVGRFLKVPDADGESMLAGKFANISPDQLKFKIIVEGANLFITQDARLALERCGVVLIKDASANKGGVTSSSLEVYAGLALSDEEHVKYMSAQTMQTAPEFYKKYVQEILDRIEENARLEFEAIWSESLRNPSMPRTLIADALSSKNVQMRANMLNSDLFENKDLVRYILKLYTPKTMLEKVDIDAIMQRVPVSYQHAICAMYLASRYVYATGMHSNEFDFFKYMNNVHNDMLNAKKLEGK
ncbi:glutamate dehydrogenase [Strigomonas culicis]|uniref:Glutamate dehydrogenase n=1 Tax=Strigomonas culicis TaxID=28005 RepID=S9UZI1_9TRYP|nr:glutamate dehydrogenase [Strigomonas culicis]EPY20041.1 glutamate dehydrogenase [Strigomonas culicis]|eukprot:EPY20041.1 glutamate dehydrogenase [Strigomonas culicis]